MSHPPSPSTPPPKNTDPPPPIPSKHQAPDLPPNKGIQQIHTLSRHSCPQCGGKGEWNPRKKELTCPYCAFEFPAQQDPTQNHQQSHNPIAEHPLLPALERLGEKASDPQQRQRQVQCSQCEAILERVGSTIQSSCDFCGSPELIAYQSAGEHIQPESLIPLSIDKEHAYKTIRDWLSNRFWAPGSLKSRSLIDKLHAVYLPYWTFDAASSCRWRAESGTYYWETESYTDSNGRRRSRRVRKTRWRPASGTISHLFDDICISASKGTNTKLLRDIEPFPTEQLVPYSTHYLSGWHVEAYQVGLKNAADQSLHIMLNSLRTLCGQQVPGDTYRNLHIMPRFNDRRYKHILVPIWLVAYQHRGKTYQCLINGVSGRIAGDHPYSILKISLAILLVLAIFAIFLLIFAYN